MTSNNPSHCSMSKGTARSHTFPSCSIWRWQSISWLWRSDFSPVRSFRRCLSVSCAKAFPLIRNKSRQRGHRVRGCHAAELPIRITNYQPLCCLTGSNNSSIVNAENTSTKMDWAHTYFNNHINTLALWNGKIYSPEKTSKTFAIF